VSQLTLQIIQKNISSICSAKMQCSYSWYCCIGLCLSICCCFSDQLTCSVICRPCRMLSPRKSWNCSFTLSSWSAVVSMDLWLSRCLVTMHVCIVTYSTSAPHSWRLRTCVWSPPLSSACCMHRQLTQPDRLCNAAICVQRLWQAVVKGDWTADRHSSCCDFAIIRDVTSPVLRPAFYCN